MKSLLRKLFGEKKKPITRRTNRFRPTLDCLEGRTLMASHVTAAINGYGDLVIEGDSNANSVTVQQLADDDWYVVGNYTKDGLTVINDQTEMSGKNLVSRAILPKFTGNLIFKMHEGNDKVEMVGSGTVAPRDIDINMGLGYDDVDLTSVRANDDIRIKTDGSGGDDVFINNVRAGGAGVDSGNNDLEITTGNYNDKVEIWQTDVGDDLRIWTNGNLDRVKLYEVEVGDLAYINTGNGHDEIDITADFWDKNIIGGDLTIDMGSNNNTLNLQNLHVYEDLRITAADYGNGADTVSMNGVDVGDMGVGGNNNDMEIDLGAGSDEVEIWNSSVRDDLRIWMNSGTIELDNVMVGKGFQETTNTNNDLEIFTGSGWDNVKVRDTFVRDDLRIATGSGGDVIDLRDVTVGDDFSVDGGSYYDNFIEDDLYVYGLYAITSIEDHDKL